MQSSAYVAAKALFERCEGRIPWPYLDCKGKATVGIGCLIDSVEAALKLPWTIVGMPASRPEIVSAWYALKAQPRLAKIGAKFAESVTALRLSQAAIDSLFATRVSVFEVELRRYFRGWDLFPADAQLGILSMAWAMGPDFAPGFPKFTAAVTALDWATAHAECTIGGEEQNAGLKPRNIANRILFANAAAVRAERLDPTRLYYPEALQVSS